MAESASEPPEIAKLGFEAALAELTALVERLESGDVPLEESIAMYERGVRLRRHCESVLARAQARVDAIRLEGGAPAGIEPLDPADSGTAQ